MVVHLDCALLGYMVSMMSAREDIASNFGRHLLTVLTVYPSVC